MARETRLSNAREAAKHANAALFVLDMLIPFDVGKAVAGFADAAGEAAVDLCVADETADSLLPLRLMARARDSYDELLELPASAHWVLATVSAKVARALTRGSLMPITLIERAVANEQDARNMVRSLGEQLIHITQPIREAAFLQRLRHEQSLLAKTTTGKRKLSRAADRLLRAFYVGSLEMGVHEWHKAQDLCGRAKVPKSTGNKVMQQLERRGFVARSDAGGHATEWQLTVEGERELRVLRREPVSLPRPKQDAGMRGSKKRPRSKGLR